MPIGIPNAESSERNTFLKTFRALGKNVTVPNVINAWVGDGRDAILVTPERGMLAVMCQADDELAGFVQFFIHKIERSYGKLYKPSDLSLQFSDQEGCHPSDELLEARDKDLGIDYAEGIELVCSPASFTRLIVSYGITAHSSAQITALDADESSDGEPHYLAILHHAVPDSEFMWTEQAVVNIDAYARFAAGVRR